MPGIIPACVIVGRVPTSMVDARAVVVVVDIVVIHERLADKDEI